MTFAIYNSPKQAVCKPLSAIEKAKKGISKTTSMLVLANKKSFQKILRIVSSLS